MQIQDLSFSGYKLLIFFLYSYDFAVGVRYSFRIVAIPILLPRYQFFSILPRLVDYAHRTKLFFSSIERDYRLLAAKAQRNPPRGRLKKACKQREIRRVNGWNRVRKERAAEKAKCVKRRKTREVLTCDSLFWERTAHSQWRFLGTR